MNLLIGSHVSMTAPHYLKQAVLDTVSYKANAFMFYSGAPQNTRRVETSKFNIEEAKQLMKEYGLDENNMILHAPYIINLANTQKPGVFELAVDFLTQEIQRAQEIGVKIIVLHPGSHVEATLEEGLNQIVKGLDLVFDRIDPKECIIALETMAGKGSETGKTFQELAYIIQHVKKPEYLGVCMDTCHLNDAGYDLTNFDAVLDEFDEVIGLDRLKVLHINDSKNSKGARKDRHENIGFGHIGFETMINIIYHPRLMHLVKILETPWIDGKIPPYREEIEMIRLKQFNSDCFEGLKDLK